MSQHKRRLLEQADKLVREAETLRREIAGNETTDWAEHPCAVIITYQGRHVVEQGCHFTLNADVHRPVRIGTCSCGAPNDYRYGALLFWDHDDTLMRVHVLDAYGYELAADLEGAARVVVYAYPERGTL